jgi:hypothetical protein
MPPLPAQTPRVGRGLAGPGRPKGSVNVATRLLKDCILMAGEQAGGKEGMTGYLRQQAIENPVAFMALLGRVLPTQIAADPDQIIVEIRRFTDEDGQITASPQPALPAPRVIENDDSEA